MTCNIILLQSCGKDLKCGASIYNIIILNRHIRVQSLSAVDIIFGDWKRKTNFLLFNHIIIIAKQYIYYCRNNNSKPVFNVLSARVKSVVQLEYKVAKGNNK